MMKKNLTRIALIFVVCALTGVAAMAKEKTRLVSFGIDFVVGGTQVKAGTYRISFNEETNELSILDKKTKSVIAKASARAENRDGSSNIFDMRWVTRDNSQVLVGITFPGASQDIVVQEGTAQAANSQ
jgi:hypothetical protein